MAKKKRRYIRTRAMLDYDDFEVLASKYPDIIKEIEAGINDGDTPVEIGRSIRRTHPHKWIQSKIIEGAARHIQSRDDND